MESIEHLKVGDKLTIDPRGTRVIQPIVRLTAKTAFTKRFSVRRSDGKVIGLDYTYAKPTTEEDEAKVAAAQRRANARNILDRASKVIPDGTFRRQVDVSEEFLAAVEALGRVMDAEQGRVAS